MDTPAQPTAEYSEAPAAAPAHHGALTVAGSFDRRNPRHLLALFAVVSLASITMILVLAGYGVHRIYANQKIHDARRDAVAMGNAIFRQERKMLTGIDRDGREVVHVKQEDFAALDLRMRNYLPPFDIFKIKVYSQDMRVVYSTDRAIIGKLNDDNAMLKRVLRDGEVNSRLQRKDLVSDLAGEARLDVDVVETYLPIIAGNAVIGSFEIYQDVTPTRNRVNKVLVSSGVVLFAVLGIVFGGLFALMRKGALWLGQAHDELRALAAIDMLTGILNRRYLMGRIEEEYTRMLRERGKAVTHDCLSFIMIDIDHFKSINDTCGHIAGDDILREVSARLKSVLREYDIIGRYGGEEFLATLPHTDLADATSIAERMRRVVRDRPFVTAGAEVKVTVSAGVARSEDSEQSMLPALRRADANLYRAKSGGRDRVCV